MSRLLQDVIVAAKAAAYVGNGASAAPCRQGSHDLSWAQGDWRYLDSYFGGSDFLGQEVLWYKGTPVWAMNYYGHIRRPDLIDAAQAGAVVKTALSALYRQGRFLGGWRMTIDGYDYRDEATGDAERFHGVETILSGETETYRLDYHGGLIRP